jgi:radical SAM protein with 4Fe4S-binding SPASM domain
MIELQSKCNWRCKHCYIDKFDASIDSEEILRVLPKLRELGCFEITLTGGEIFLRDDILDLIRRMRQCGFNIVLFSNASLIDEKTISELSLLCIDLFSCTLFSTNHLIHDDISCASGSHKRVKRNLRLLRDYNIPVQVKTIIMKDNVNEIDNLQKYCDEMGFRFKPDLAVFSRIDGNGENQKCMLESDQMRAVITKVDDITGYQIPSGNRCHEKVCAQILHSFSIDWYGNIHPCNRLKTILGNIVTDEISDVWNNSPILMKIAETCWNDLPECSVCEYMKYCVRCAGGALDEFNSIYSKSTVACAITRARHSNANIDI